MKGLHVFNNIIYLEEVDEEFNTAQLLFNKTYAIYPKNSAYVC